MEQKFTPSPHFRRMFISLAEAYDHIRLGSLPEARTTLEQSRKHANDHIKHLTEAGLHDEIKSVSPEIDKYFTRAHHLIARAENRKNVKVATKMTAFPAPTPLPMKAIKKAEGYGDNAPKPGQTRTSQLATKTPGINPRYNYKHYSDLPAESRKKADIAFQGKDMDQFHYATDPNSGDFVFTTRAKMPEQNARPTAPMTPSLKPEHRNGAAIRIDSPGSVYHGKLGMVRGTAGLGTNKLNVQIGGQNDLVQLEHHQVKLSSGGARAAGMSKSERFLQRIEELQAMHAALKGQIGKLNKE